MANDVIKYNFFGGLDNCTVAPVASFTYSGTLQNAETLTFTDSSTNLPNVWAWDFGDGSGTSSTQSPTYSYSVNGTYIVGLTASNDCGSSYATASLTITAKAPDEIFGTSSMYGWWNTVDSAIIKDGSDKVSSWEDNAYGANYFTQSGAAMPLWVDNEINTHPTIRFTDGVTSLRTTLADNITDNTPVGEVYSIFILYKIQDATPNKQFYIFDDLWENRLDFDDTTPVDRIRYLSLAAGNVTRAAALTTQVYHLAEIGRSGVAVSASSQMHFHTDNIFTGYSSVTYVGDSNNPKFLSGDVDICEVIIIAGQTPSAGGSTITQSERDQLMTYFNDRWALTLPKTTFP
jgi:PKD repeat protein